MKPLLIERRCWVRASLPVMAFLVVSAFGQSPAIRNWDLRVAATDADFSIDDRFLAVTVETTNTPADGHSYATESVQIWDYRDNRKISGAELATYLKAGPTPNCVRYTADGKMLVSSDPTRLYVLDPSSLKLLRVINPELSTDFRIFHIETAPTGHVVLIAANRVERGILVAYDLDSGRLLFKWKSPRRINSVDWNSDGTRFAVAAPLLCTRIRDTLEVFGTNPWSHLRTLTARNPASLAFSQGRLFWVESGYCKGSLIHRQLGLESFDTRTWDRQKAVFLRERDIHDSISFANSRLVADTGKLELKHDWLDGTSWGDAVSIQFTLWAGEPASVEFTSPSWPIPLQPPPAMSQLRLSRTGKMVVLIHNRSPRVMEIP